MHLSKDEGAVTKKFGTRILCRFSAKEAENVCNVHRAISPTQNSFGNEKHSVLPSGPNKNWTGRNNSGLDCRLKKIVSQAHTTRIAKLVAWVQSHDTTSLDNPERLQPTVDQSPTPSSRSKSQKTHWVEFKSTPSCSSGACCCLNNR